MESRSRPKRMSAKAAFEKMKDQGQCTQDKLISKIVSMGFNRKAVELAVFQEGYQDTESM